jgi:hypothetical protein
MSLISSVPEWNALLQQTRAIGKSLEIESEADIERLCDEFRDEQRGERSDTPQNQHPV